MYFTIKNINKKNKCRTPGWLHQLRVCLHSAQGINSGSWESQTPCSTGSLLLPSIGLSSTHVCISTYTCSLSNVKSLGKKKKNKCTSGTTIFEFHTLILLWSTITPIFVKFYEIFHPRESWPNIEINLLRMH